MMVDVKGTESDITSEALEIEIRGLNEFSR